MPETPMQKLSALRFLLMMIEKRLVNDGKKSGGQVALVVTHPPEKLNWLVQDDPFWLEIRDFGCEYQVTVLTEEPKPAIEVYRISQANLPTWIAIPTPTLEDWERITHWIVKGNVVEDREIPETIKRRLGS